MLLPFSMVTTKSRHQVTLRGIVEAWFVELKHWLDGGDETRHHLLLVLSHGLLLAFDKDEAIALRFR